MLILDPYQEEGVKALIANKRFLLFDEPGLGKSIQLLRAADLVSTDAIRVIAPAITRPQWKRTITDESMLGLTPDVDSYDVVRSKGDSRQHRCLVIDESHYLKNRKAQRTQIMYGEDCNGKSGVVSRAEYVWCATGTPAPNNPTEMYTTLRSVVPDSIRKPNGDCMTPFEFMSRYTKWKDTPFGVKIEKGKNLRELRERLAPYCLRRRYADVGIAINRPRISPLYFDLGNAVKDLRKIEDKEDAKLLVLAFQQGETEVLKKYENSTLRRAYGLALIKPITEQILSDIDGGIQKMVVVAYHRDVILGVQKALADHKVKSVTIMGGMTESQKETAKTAFTTGAAPILIGQVTAMGTGYDGLQYAAHHMLFIELAQGGMDNWQAIARLARRGQTKPVFVRVAIIEGTLHEQIVVNVKQRTQDATTLLDGE